MEIVMNLWWVWMIIFFVSFFACIGLGIFGTIRLSDDTSSDEEKRGVAGCITSLFFLLVTFFSGITFAFSIVLLLIDFIKS